MTYDEKEEFKIDFAFTIGRLYQARREKKEDVFLTNAQQEKLRERNPVLYHSLMGKIKTKTL